MGWTTFNPFYKKQDVIRRCIDWGKHITLLSHTVIGSRLWVLLKYNQGERKGQVFVAFYLIKKWGNEWGYKNADDTCMTEWGYYDCPLSYVKQTVDSNRVLDKNTIEWHKKVYAHHEQKKERKAFRDALDVGDEIQFEGEVFKLIENRARKGWVVLSSTNARYLLKVKQINASTLVKKRDPQAA